MDSLGLADSLPAIHAITPNNRAHDAESDGGRPLTPCSFIHRGPITTRARGPLATEYRTLKIT